MNFFFLKHSDLNTQLYLARFETAFPSLEQKKKKIEDRISLTNYAFFIKKKNNI